MNRSLISILILLVVLISACKEDPDLVIPTPEPLELIEGEQSIAETIEISSDFSAFQNALETTGLLTGLEEDEPFTIFAPTDAAFAKIPDGVLERLSTLELTSVLQYHVLENLVESSELTDSQLVATVQGEELFIELGESVQINRTATVTDADYATTNGVIHTVDELIFPPGIREQNLIDRADYLGVFSTFLTAIEDAGLTITLMYDGNYTIFAPNDDAFAALPDGYLASLSDKDFREIIRYHVINSSVLSRFLEESQNLVSLSGEELFVTYNGSEVMVNGGKCNHTRSGCV